MHGRGKETDPLESCERGAEVLRLLPRDVNGLIRYRRTHDGRQRGGGPRHPSSDALFYAHISNLIKVKDVSWVDATKVLAPYAKIAFKRFFSPRYQVDEEIFKRLNIGDHDHKV